MTLLTADEVMNEYHYKKSTFYERRKECLLSDYQDAVILDGKTLIDKRRWEEFIKYRSEQKKRKLMGIDWGRNYGKDFETMAALFRHIHRHRAEKRKLAANLINCSNCWTGINDYRFKHAREIARDIKKARRPSDFQNNSLLKNSLRRLYHNGMHWYRS